MNKSRARVFTWSIMTAGAVVGAGQSLPYYDPSAKDYLLNAQFKNNPPIVMSVAGLPTLGLTDLEPMLAGAITTDAAGRIAGVQYARVYFGGGSNQPNNHATYVINVTGMIRTKGTAPTVKVTFKGNGYEVAGETHYPDASLALKFISDTGPTTATPNQAVVVTNLNYAETYLDGTTVLFTNGPETKVNNNRYFSLSGTITGTIKHGRKSTVNGRKPLKIDEAATFISESWIWTVLDGTNFVQQNVGGSLGVNVLSNITAQVIQPSRGTKLYLVGGVGSSLDLYSGAGKIDKNAATYKAKLRGVSSVRGAVLELDGTLGPVIIGYQQTTNVIFPTGYVTNYVLDAIKTVNFSGKAVGQKIPLTSGVNADVPFRAVP